MKLKQNITKWLTGLLLSGPLAATAVQTVTTLTDGVPPPPGSLRGAIAAAAATDTIQFQSGLAGTISLTSRELLIDKNLTISGPGADFIAVSGAPGSNVFNVASGRTVAISGLTITRGEGASVLNNGALTLTACNVVNSSRIVNVGTLTVTRCVIANNVGSAGGGIFTGGSTPPTVTSLTVISCTITNNRARTGGGVFATRPVVIRDSLLAGNNVRSDSDFEGGAGLQVESTALLTNVTISGNTNEGASVGAILASSSDISGNIQLEYCTVTDNHIGRFGTGTSAGVISACSPATVTYRGTIVSGNDGPQFDTGHSCFLGRVGTLTSLGFNISSDSSGNLNAPFDQPRTDPLLRPLADNGGLTLTHVLLPGSPALDHGDPSHRPATDQRGAPRPAAAGCLGTTAPDVGAFELQRSVVTTIADSGPGSLRQAVLDNNTFGGSDICFSLPLPNTIQLLNGPGLQISKSVRIFGPGASALTVDRRNNVPASNVFGTFNSDTVHPITVSISGLTITGIPGAGAGIDNGGANLDVSKCAIKGNSPGIANGGSLTVSESLLTGNSGDQGAALTSLGPCVMRNVTASLNTCTGGAGRGGAIAAVNGSHIVLEYCTVVSNSAFFAGISGGVRAVGSGSDVSSHGTIVSSNAGPQFTAGVGSTLTSLGYNISSDNTGNLTATGDKPNTNPLLGPLANNGGPTATHAPLTFGGLIFSPAIDAGDPASFPATDQRGAKRPQDGNSDHILRADVGAVELTPVGAFDLVPTVASVEVKDRLTYAFTWTVPDPQNWHNLRNLDFLIHDGNNIILLVRFDEASGTFSLFNEASGKFGKGFAPGSHHSLETPEATLDLADTTVVGSGPTGPSVTLNLALSFKPKAAGHTYTIAVAASNDAGESDDFQAAGTVTVLPEERGEKHHDKDQDEDKDKDTDGHGHGKGHDKD